MIFKIFAKAQLLQIYLTIFQCVQFFDNIRITKANAPKIKFRSYKSYQLVDFIEIWLMHHGILSMNVLT